MLERIRLQNFKTHRDTEIQLGRLTVLVGPNGAGKSSVLQAIEMLRSLVDERQDRAARVGSSSVLDPMQMRPYPGEVVGPCAVHIVCMSTDGQSWNATFTTTSAEKVSSTIKLELSAIMLMPNPAQLAAPAVSVVTPTLGSDGAGLADVVAKMQLEDPESFQALQGSLKAVVPQIQRIGVKRTQVRLPTTDAAKPARHGLGHELTFDVAGRKGIPASMMSGGTLLALGILALLHSPARPRILLLDDIDHGLHPRAQWDLLKQLRALLERFPDLQIVATSHSPDLVDELAPEEVVVMALREDGTTAAKPLTACPREDMLGVLKAGQLWSAIGEDWVKLTEPRP